MLADRPIACPIVVGRAPVVEALQRWLGRLAAAPAAGEGGPSAPRVALLAGEAGLGKSRLAAEAARWAHAAGFSVLQGNCFEPDRGLPFAPLLDLLRGWLAATPTGAATAAAERLRPFAPELVKLLPELGAWLPGAAPTPALEPEQEKRRHFHTLSQVLNQLAPPPGQALILIEDAHWADDTSLEFLLHLPRRGPGALLITYRDDEIGPAFGHCLAELERGRLALEYTLDRLSAADVEAMIRAIFEQAQPVQPEFVQAIHGLTDGNPFFVEETLKSLVAAGDIYYAGGGWTRKPLGALVLGNRLPRSVQDAVQRRMSGLSAPARELLALAAVAGRRFDFTLLRQLTGQSEAELLALMKELLAAQLVVEETAERFAFRHALTREAVYGQLLERERQARHGLIGQALEQLAAGGGAANGRAASAADLAYHFEAAGAWAQAAGYAQQAAEQALAADAPRAASEHCAQAARAARQAGLAVPPSLWRLQGQAHDLLGDFEAARGAYTQVLEAARQTHDLALEWQSRLDLGFLWTGRDYARAQDDLQQALGLARALNDPAALARSLNRVGNWYTNSDQPAQGLACHQEALRLFQGLGDARGLAETLDLLGTACYFGGDIFRGAEAYAAAAAGFRQLGQRRGLASSLVMLGTRGANYLHDALAWPPTDLAAAQRESEEALQIAREIGSRSDEAFASIYLAYALGPQGEFGRALAYAQAGLEIANEMAHRQWQLAAHMALGLAHLDLLALPEALAHLEQAAAIASQMGSLFTIRATAGCLIRGYAAAGRLEAAEALYVRVGGPDLPRQTLAQRLVQAAYAELLLARGQWGAALAAVDQLLASAQAGPNGQALIPRLLEARGQALAGLGRAAEAEQTWRQAAGVAPRNQAWRLHLALGKLALPTGRPTETARAAAAREFALARAQATALADSLPAGARRDNFLAQALARLPALRAQPARPAPGGLTRREQEIARLVAAGQTNREIAAGLVIGERTVEGHVGNILGKLGFSSRAQIAAWAVKEGLG